MSLTTFTIFCCQANGQGTTHIDTVESRHLRSAILAGRKQCLKDWNGGKTGSFSLKDIHCLGVAEGNVRILHWEDPDE